MQAEAQPRDLFAAVTAAATASLSAGPQDEGRHSPHAAQLEAGFRWLRFQPALEAEFRDFHARRYRVRTRIALFGCALVLALFALRDMRELPATVWHWTVALRLGVMVPAILAVWAATRIPSLQRIYEPFATVGILLASLALGAALLLTERLHAPLPYEGVMLVMIFTIFLSGLRFYAASVAAFLPAAAYIAGRWALDLPEEATLAQGSYLFVVALIGLVGSYSLELTQRANFLTEQVAVFRATHDALTHLHNRRSVFDHLQRTWKLAFRERRGVAVILIDVDHFKRFNDTYGHQRGDRCLASVAAALRERVQRPMDLAGRYGGEEFIVTLYDVRESALDRISADLLAAVRELRIVHEGNPVGTVTISAGAAWVLPAGGAATMEGLIESADRALYAAKAGGRDRCVRGTEIRAVAA